MNKRNIQKFALYIGITVTLTSQLLSPNVVEAKTQDDINAKSIESLVEDKIEKNVLVYVGEEPVFRLENKESYDVLVKKIEKELSHISENSEIKKLKIEPALSMEITPLEVGEVKTIDEAYILLSQGGYEEAIYIAEEKETLSSIAKKYDMTMEEIKDLNPNWEDPITKGSVIKVFQKAPMIEVSSEEIITSEEAIPFETIVQKDDSLYKGQTQVYVQGVEGKKRTKTFESKVNGQVQYSLISSVEIAKEPINQIVLEGTKELAATGSFINPTNGRLSSGFGPRWGSFHYGIDIANSIGTTIKAADGGVVTKAKYAGSYGNMVEIDHQNGYKTRYAHMSFIGVEVGQKISQGQSLGKMGSTGRSTGSHLHFEIIENDVRVNPLNFVTY